MKTDLRAWLNAVEAHGELKTVDGTEWNKEIGTLVDLNAKARGQALAFDQMERCPAGFRPLAGARAGAQRVALTLAMPLGLEGLNGIRSREERMRGWRDGRDPFRPIVPKNGGVVQTVDEGDA